jgi:predicted MFS family arabinose efflux permease
MSDLARRSGLIVVFATVCVDLLGFGLVMPLLPLYGTSDAKLAEPAVPAPPAFATAHGESPPARLVLVFAYIIAFVFPAVQSLLSRRSDPADQGAILGAQESVSSIARIAGMAFGVRTFRQVPALPYGAAAAMMAVALLLAVLAARVGRDWESQDPSS